MFCSKCSKEAPEGSSFGPSCGYNQSLSSVAEGSKKLIGIVKELDTDEKVSFENKIVTPVFFIKEAEIKKTVGGTKRREVPISIAMTNIYLTNKKLVFLVLYQLQATALADSRTGLSGISGTWFEMPLSAIKEVDIRPLKLDKDFEKNFKNRVYEWGLSEQFEKRPSTELIYDEKVAHGRTKDYMESLLDRGRISKLFGKIERVYDKLLILGEETVSITPALRQIVK